MVPRATAWLAWMIFCGGWLAGCGLVLDFGPTDGQGVDGGTLRDAIAGDGAALDSATALDGAGTFDGGASDAEVGPDATSDGAAPDGADGAARDAGPLMQGDTCGSGPELGVGTYTFDTCAATDDHPSTCDTIPGPEVFYVLRSRAEVYLAASSGFGVETMVASCGGSFTTCGGGSVNADGTDVYVMIEKLGEGCGAGTLTVTSP